MPLQYWNGNLNFQFPTVTCCTKESAFLDHNLSSTLVCNKIIIFTVETKTKKSTKQKGIWLIFTFFVVVCLLIKETLLIIVCLFLKARNFSSKSFHQKKCYTWKIQTSKFKNATINRPLYPLVESLKN